MIKVVTILQGTMSAFMAGVMIGAFMLGKLADRWEIVVFLIFFHFLHSSFQTPPRIGRKHTITITVLGITVFNTLSGVTGSFNIYVGAKFATGFFCAGNILSMFVLSNELVGGSKRALVGTTMQVLSLEGLLTVAISPLLPGLFCSWNCSLCSGWVHDTGLAIPDPNHLLDWPSLYLISLASSRVPTLAVGSRQAK